MVSGFCFKNLPFAEQNQFRELLRIKAEDSEDNLEDNEKRWYDQLRLIIMIRRIEMGELTEKNTKTWEAYEDLQLQELTDKRDRSELSDADKVAVNEVQVQVLRRAAVPHQDNLTFEQILQLKKLLNETDGNMQQAIPIITWSRVASNYKK